MTKHIVLLGILLLLLAGCSSSSWDSIWPSFGEDTAAQAGAETATKTAADQNADANTASSAAPPATGTAVGQKVQSLHTELQRLQGLLAAQHNKLQDLRSGAIETVQRYHGTVAAVTSRLQLGTTPGNPVLISQWQTAQAQLQQIGEDIAALNALSGEVAGNAAIANFVSESAQASYNLTGAVEEDHRQLAMLEDETERTVVLIDRLLNEINHDVVRQSAYVANERVALANLSQAISDGELYGPRATAAALAVPPAAGIRPLGQSAAASRFDTSGRSPLVVIRFDSADVDYEQSLYRVLSQTLRARPNAQFDLVAVAPGTGNPTALAQSKQIANRVLRSMTEMGLPPNRIDLAAVSDAENSVNEVHIFVR